MSTVALAAPNRQKQDYRFLRRHVTINGGSYDATIGTYYARNTGGAYGNDMGAFKGDTANMGKGTYSAMSQLMVAPTTPR